MEILNPKSRIHIEDASGNPIELHVGSILAKQLVEGSTGG
jgi:hypothetical protein